MDYGEGSGLEGGIMNRGIGTGLSDGLEKNPLHEARPPIRVKVPWQELPRILKLHVRIVSYVFWEICSLFFLLHYFLHILCIVLKLLP
jgi:hypothetical protein